jgi:opacity protein-like surface antigen
VRVSVPCGALCALLLGGTMAQAQAFLPMTGFATVPSFAWSEPTLAPGGVKWDGSYARISTGFQVSTSKHSGTRAGPTIGLEAGKMWRDGNVIYGVVGAVDYMPAIGGYATPGFNSVAYSRDFAGAFQIKTGVLVTPEVLLYTKVGATAVNESWRFGANSFSGPFSRSEIAVRPEARAGVEWAVTNQLTLGLEVGIVGAPIR